MTGWLALLVDVLAAHRFTRLVAADVITEEPRRAVVLWAFRRAGIDLHVEEGEPIVDAIELHEQDAGVTPKLATLVTCRWCAGAYVAMAVTALRWRWPRLWGPVGWAAAVSSAAALVAGLEDD